MCVPLGLNETPTANERKKTQTRQARKFGRLSYIVNHQSLMCFSREIDKQLRGTSRTRATLDCCRSFQLRPQVFFVALCVCFSSFLSCCCFLFSCVSAAPCHRLRRRRNPAAEAGKSGLCVECANPNKHQTCNHSLELVLQVHVLEHEVTLDSLAPSIFVVEVNVGALFVLISCYLGPVVTLEPRKELLVEAP